MLNIRNCFELLYFGLINRLFLQFISHTARIRIQIRNFCMFPDPTLSRIRP